MALTGRKPVLTAEEKYMLTQKQLEKELISLRQEYSVLEKSRNNPHLGGCYLKHKKVTDLFAKEHQNILDDLSRAADSGRKREDSKLFDGLCQEMALYDYLIEQVTRNKVYMKEVQEEIKVVKKSLYHLRKLQVTDRQYEDRIWNAMKTMEALENKLETQMIKFGTICTRNKAMREEIDHLLWDRRNFLVHWHRFIERLNAGKQIMLDLIEQATIAYNQREEWCNKLQALRIRAHQDYVANVEEIREYIRRQDQNSKLEEFFVTKGQKRVMRDLLAKVRERRLRREEELRETLDRYREMVEEVKSFTKERKVEEIARKFAVQDEYNLSNFKYIIDAMMEMETVSESLEMYQMDIEEKKLLHEARRQQQQMNLQELEELLEQCCRETGDVRGNLEHIADVLDKLLRGVAELFRICRCNRDPLLQLLGHNEHVMSFNVLFYINLVESAVHELLVKAYYKDKAMLEKKKTTIYKPMIVSDEASPKIYEVEKIVKATPCSLCVEHELVADVIDTVQTPISRQVAVDRILNRTLTPAILARLHTISDCQLPQSRGIIQKRYQ